MTATDELRLMLDERWIEYEVDDAKTVRVTRWRAYGDWVSFIEYDNGDTKFCIDARRLTPEQAIAATLGGGYQGFWTHDGTLHIELPKLPESILVCLPDKRDREVRSARVLQYTLGDADATRERQGVGTCHISVQDNLAETEGMGDVWLECDACNWQMPLEPSTPHFNFCPNCGKKVVDE